MATLLYNIGQLLTMDQYDGQVRGQDMGNLQSMKITPC